MNPYIFAECLIGRIAMRYAELEDQLYQQINHLHGRTHANEWMAALRRSPPYKLVSRRVADPMAFGKAEIWKKAMLDVGPQYADRIEAICTKISTLARKRNVIAHGYKSTHANDENPFITCVEYQSRPDEPWIAVVWNVVSRQKKAGKQAREREWPIETKFTLAQLQELADDVRASLVDMIKLTDAVLRDHALVESKTLREIFGATKAPDNE